MPQHTYAFFEARSRQRQSFYMKMRVWGEQLVSKCCDSLVKISTCLFLLLFPFSLCKIRVPSPWLKRACFRTLVLSNKKHSVLAFYVL